MPSDSEVGIASAALRRLGAQALTSFADPTTEGILANDTYDQLRDDLLRDHPWTFAKKRTSLAASAVAPSWGYDRAFPVPTDFLRLLEVDGQALEAVKVESHEGALAILSDLAAPISILYTARIEDANLMDVKFKEALILKCRHAWAPALSAAPATKIDRFLLDADRAAAVARAADGQQGTPDTFGINTWVNAR